RLRQADLVAGPPIASHLDVAPRHDPFLDGLPVDRQLNAVSGPTRNPQPQPERSLTRNVDPDLPIPRIPRPLSHFDRPAGLQRDATGSLGIQVNPDRVVRDAVDVPRQ